MEQSIRFTFLMMDRIFQTGYTPDYNTPGWADLKLGAEIRNRLTHPKSARDLDVSESEIDVISRGCQWILDTFPIAMSKGIEHLRQFENERVSFFESLPREKLQSLHHALGESFHN